MKSKVKIQTSFVSPVTLDYFKKNNILPVFIIRNIKNSELIGKWSNTAVHFRDFAPSNELFRSRRDGQIDIDSYKKQYALEITERTNLQTFINTLESLVELSGAKSVVLLSYGSDYNSCHRSVLGMILNSSGLLENEVSEIKVWKEKY